MVAGQAPKDCSQEIELAQSRLDRVRQQKKEAVTLRVRYALADREFADLIEELSQAEADVSREIAELKATQLKIPDTAQIRNWLAEMLTIDKLQAWLKNDDPANVRSVLAGRIRVKCYQRPYKSSEPAPTVELCL